MVRSHTFDPTLPSSPDHRTLNCGTRKVYDHVMTLVCIKRGYLGNSRLILILDGNEFDVMVCISKTCFKRLRMDIAALGDPFYVHLP